MTIIYRTPSAPPPPPARWRRGLRRPKAAIYYLFVWLVLLSLLIWLLLLLTQWGRRQLIVISCYSYSYWESCSYSSYHLAAAEGGSGGASLRFADEQRLLQVAIISRRQIIVLLLRLPLQAIFKLLCLWLLINKIVKMPRYVWVGQEVAVCLFELGRR